MQKQTSNPGQNTTAAAVAPAHDPAGLEALLKQAATPEQFCAELSRIFRVRQTEVAMLKLERGLLRFLFPDELKIAGSIPLSSSSAVAAHTALTRKVELFNGFVKVKHASVFETVKLGKQDTSDQMEAGTIQKLMSAPVLGLHEKVLGVIQICRKGFDLPSSGADFTLDDLQRLELAAAILAKMPFLQ